MTRRNLAPNPALGVDLTGWGGSNAPTREAVTGFVRPWSARYLASDSFVRTPKSAISEGLVYTFSVYMRITSAFLTTTIGTYIGWYTDENGSGSQFDQVTLGPFDNNTIVRLVRTGTAPTGKAFADLIFDSWGGNQTHLDFTAMLIEQTGVVDGYADGNSPGWVWDGTPELSSSTETGSATRGTASPVVRDTSRALFVSRAGPSMAALRRNAPSMQKGAG